jgi:phosphatidylserine/phosphatidylglycerophosphate/cardiolipin synthase-like enzyme
MGVAVLHERLRRTGPELQLVWTGPEGTSSSARDTATVVRELFCRAQRSVLIAGYAFDHGADILRPLHAAMETRGVEVSMFLHVPRCPPGADPLDHLRRWESKFLRDNWRFSRRPSLYYDPRSVRSDSVVSLHAKCVVVDETLSLITSANLTERGQDRNIEVGVQIDDPAFGRRLTEQWRSALAAGVFSPLPPGR